MTHPARQFLHMTSRAKNEVRELLQALFVAELLAPSRCMWLVSPWLRDLPVVDNTSAEFQALDPDWSRRPILLSEVLLGIARRGATVVVATRPGDDTTAYLANTLEQRTLDAGVAGQLRVIRRENLHAKGLLGDTYCLSGSMNFTFSGVNYSDELLTFQTDPHEVHALRLMFEREYGGVL